MTEEAQISVSVNGNEVVIAGGGCLDLRNSRKFRDALLQAGREADSVTVDLRSAVFIDTAILAYLAEAGQAMLKRDRRLKVLVSQNSHPWRVLETVGFGVIMDIAAEPGAPETAVQ